MKRFKMFVFNYFEQFLRWICKQSIVNHSKFSALYIITKCNKFFFFKPFKLNFPRFKPNFFIGGGGGLGNNPNRATPNRSVSVSVADFNIVVQVNKF
jgi:hypothetical protein